jgi:hypothetical protein
MANSPNLITRSLSLADLLATAVSDGTYSDVVETTKTDASGQAAAATDIAEYGGQLISNLWDDATIRVVQMYDRGTKVWLPADAAARDAIGSDDDLEANALCMLADTKALYYCVSVDGGSASTWAALPASGNISGPGATTDHAIVRWDGAVGGVVQNSVVIVSDAGAVTGITTITTSGLVNGRNIATDGTTLDTHVANISNPHSVLLSQTLAAGNQTDGNSIEISLADEINGEDGGHVRFAAGTGLVETSDLTCDGILSATGRIVGDALVIGEAAAVPYTAAGFQTVWAKNTIPSTLWTTDDAGNDYQVSTGTTPSLALVLAIGSTTGANTIVVSSGQSVRGAPGSSSAGGALPLVGGTGDGSGNAGGAMSVTGGTGSAHAGGGAGGAVTIAGGIGGSTSGAGGAASLSGGAGTAGVSAGGAVTISGGAPSGAAAGGAVSITGGSALSGDIAGSAVALAGGVGAGTQAGGAVSMTAGAGGATGAGGAVAMFAGAGGGTSGNGGASLCRGGAGTNGNGVGGESAIVGGAGQGSGTGGDGRVTGGAGGATGVGGRARLTAGAGGATSGTGGASEVTAGAGTGATATGGAASVTAGAGGSGAATGGAISITSGAGGATSGNSGAVNIASGAVTSGTRGTITLNGSDVIVTNQGYHSVRGATARGTVNTLIYRWTSVVDNVGADITYTDSGNDGGSWAIVNAGVYSVCVSIDAGHAGYIAIKKAAALSNTFDETSIQVAAESAPGETITASWTGYCSVGDDIWIATSAVTNPTGTPVNNNRVTVTRVR